MRILFVADGRSPIALNWISHFAERDQEVHLVSTFSSSPPIGIASYTHIPVAFSGLKRQSPSIGVYGFLSGSNQIQLRTRFRHWFGPFTLPIAAGKLSQVVRDRKPDVVHAMRIPFEGMMAAQATFDVPLITSVWGNDFTLHAPSTRRMGMLTRRTLQRSAGLHTDCYRDLNLAKVLGFPSTRPALVVPGAGGILPDIFYPPSNQVSSQLKIQEHVLNIPVHSPVIVNPRGFRAYVRNDTFFQSIPLILEKEPESIFLCPAMKGVEEAERWVAALGIGDAVHLLPRLTPSEMGELLRRSQISVSISEHDGTPNTLLEAMACGCFPIAGDIDSIREWIQSEKNGLLVDPSHPAQLAEAVLKALNSPELFADAKEINLELIRDRAIRSEVMARVEGFYQELV